MNEPTWRYLSQLTRALQAQDVDGTRAGDFVAEIDSHLAESGTDPVEELGSPHQLAVEFAGRPGSRRPGWLPPLWAVWPLGLLAVALLVVAADAVMLGWDQRGIPIRARGIAWTGIVYVASLSLGYAATRRLDGRSWSALLGSRPTVAILTIAVAATAAAQLLGERVIARVAPAWFWTVTVVVVPVLFAAMIRRNNPIRFPPHAQHLRRLTRGPLAGRPPMRSSRSS